jgi:hypothetical protein
MILAILLNLLTFNQKNIIDMTRVDSILESPFLKSNRMRKFFKVFIEDRLRISDNHDVLLTNLPLNYVINTSGNFNEEICTHIRDAKIFIDFDHNAGDKVFQKLFFLFLIYSLQHYPDIDSWTEFINKDQNTKRQTIKNGIDKVWGDFQSRLIENELDQEFEDNDPQEFEDNDPF